jgi:hypothetical protein
VPVKLADGSPLSGVTALAAGSAHTVVLVGPTGAEVKQ